MKLSEHVFKLECTKGSYAYAIKTEDGVTLIDTSLPGRVDKILEELNTYGIEPNEIQRILLTHHDIDHIGNSASLSERTGCEVYISETDLPYVLGQKSRDGIKKLIGALMKVKIPKAIRSFEGEYMGDFQIIPTPGHTRGHCCIKYKNVLFTGDLISEKNGRISPAPQIMTWDRKLLLESAKSMDIDGIEWICPAHGEPIEAKHWHDFIKRII